MPAARIIVLSSLCSCAVGPDYQRPDVALNVEWAEKDNDPAIDTTRSVETEWWRTFDDATLVRLVDLAHEQNLSLQVAALRIAEARAQLGIAWGQVFPQVQVAFGQVTAQRLSESAPNAGQQDRSFIDYQVGFDMFWELDLWGRYRRGIEAEEANVNAAELDYQDAFVSLSAEVARTYTAVRTFEALIGQAEENARIEEEGLQMAESRFRNGATTELDVTQARALLESTRATIPRLEIALEQSRNALSTLLGQPPGTIDPMLATTSSIAVIPRAPSTVAIGMPADLLRRRPDVRSAEQRAASQAARVGVAKSEYYPKLAVAGTFGLEATTGAGAPEFDFVDNLFYSVGPRIVWPFLNYGRIGNAVEVEESRYQQLLVEYRDTVLRAAGEVENALAGYRESQRALVFEERSVAAAQRSLEIAHAAYREGAVDFQRVLDAQRALLDAQNRMVEARSSVTTQLIALYRALGGGWKPNGGTP